MSDLEADLKRLAKAKGFGPLTEEEAQAAYEAATPEPLSKERIDEMVRRATRDDPMEGEPD